MSFISIVKPEDHFKSEHPEIYNARPLKTRCRCGCYFDDQVLFTRHYEAYVHTNSQLPPRDVIKINTDGACQKLRGAKEGLSGGAGLLRDHEGVARLLEPLGITNDTLAEIHAMARGLSLIARSNFNRAIVGTDNKRLLGLLEKVLKLQVPDELSYIVNKKIGNEAYWYLLLKIRSILVNRKIHFTISHMYRDAIKIADILAKSLREATLRIHGTHKWLPAEEVDDELAAKVDDEVAKVVEVDKLVKNLRKQLKWDAC